ncbi:hypothetical protein AHAS_Ahas14G0167100 [Arachis hypogaea]
MINSQESCAVVNNARHRWQVAFAAIYSYRAIASLFNEVAAKRNHNTPSSFVAIHVGEPDLFFSDLNKTRISNLVKDKDHGTLAHQFGGVDGLVRLLQTDERNGINGSPEEISCRHKAFGFNNNYHKLTTKSFLHYVLSVMKDPILIILLVCATLSLVFNIRGDGFIHGWYNGGSIFIAVLVVVAVCSISHFWPYRHFNKLLQMSNENQFIQVVRNGQEQQVLVSDIVVGDVVCLRNGCQVPADGVLLSSNSLLPLLVDESTLGVEHQVEVSKGTNPFLFSGTKVDHGHGKMLVTSVGENTKWNEIMSLLGQEPHKWRSLESRLIALTRITSIIGSVVTASTLIVLLVRFFSGYMRNNDGSLMFRSGKSNAYDAWPKVVGLMVSAVAVATSAIPEGLPLAVAITVSYAVKRMLKNQALFRQFSACVQLASTTVICTDTNEILTPVKQNKFKLWLGKKFFIHEEGEDSSSSLSQLIAANIRHLVCLGIGLGHISNEDDIICWAATELGMDAQESREGFNVLHVETLNEEMKQRKVLLRNEGDHTIHVHVNGKAEGILSKCSYYYGVKGDVKALDNDTRRNVECAMQLMEQERFKCIAFAHKALNDISESHPRIEDDTLVLLALIGFKDLIHSGVPEAVQDCKQAGVNIKLITSEDVSTAKAIASECGILHPNQEFFTGNSPGDAPALVEGDVAIHMGFKGNNIAVENSDIVVLNGGFVSFFSVLQIWRGIYDNIRVFIQFLLAANLASLVTDFVSIISTDQPPTINILTGISVQEIPYAVLQILWLKLIIGTLAVLAIVVERKTTDEFMREQQPARPNQPLISNEILKNILIHASHEIAVLLTFQFKGENLLAIDGNVKDTFVFNLLVLFQVFAVLKARKLDGRGIFKGTGRTKLFWGIIFGIVILQVVMVKSLAIATGGGDLNMWQWGASVGIAFTSWPIQYIGSKLIVVSQEPFICNVL